MTAGHSSLEPSSSQHGYLAALISLAIDDAVLACPPAASVGDNLGTWRGAWETASAAPVQNPGPSRFRLEGFVMAGGMIRFS